MLFSFGFGPIALLLPLHGRDIVFAALCNPQQSDNVSKREVIGIIIILIGLSITVIFGPRSRTATHSTDDLFTMLNDSASLIAILTTLLCVFLNWLLLQIPKHTHKLDELQLLSFVHIAGYFSAWTILCLKLLLELSASSLSTSNWTHWLPYLLLLALPIAYLGAQHWRKHAYAHYPAASVGRVQ